MRIGMRPNSWMIALVCAGAFAPAGWAQDMPQGVDGAPAELRGGLPGAGQGDAVMEDGLDGELLEAELTSDERALLDNALFSNSPAFGSAPAKPLRLRRLVDPGANRLDVARNDGADGSSTVVVKKPLAAALSEWDAHVGADLGLAHDPAAGFNPNNPLRTHRGSPGSGAAWASIGVERFATVDARVSPSNDQGLVATTFKHSVPVGSRMSVTLQSRTSLTETFGQAPAAQSDIPMMAVPAADPSSPVPRVWGQENSARLDIASTGTTFGAGLSSNSTDPVTHNTLSAEQTIYGPLRVTTAVTDIGQPWENKSVSARFKLNW